MNSIDRYVNLIELLKKALEFYADEKVYTSADGVDHSIIFIDKGSQARFALLKIVELEKNHEKILNEYKEILDKYYNDGDDDLIGLNMGDDNTNISIVNILESIKGLSENSEND